VDYKVIVRDRETGEEKYIEGLNKAASEKEALTQARDGGKQVYISWTDAKGRSGYLNRDGATENCPGEPW
jgi:hypothetical protein